MSWGSTNEYLIFPLLELIHKEVKRIFESGEITLSLLEALEASRGSTNVVINQITNQTNYQLKTALSLLESNDFDLKLIKDENNKLKAVEIKYSEDIRALIELIRESGKLSLVNVNLFSKEQMQDEVSNPYGMVLIDFFEYVRNKYLWERYNEVYNNEDSSIEDKEFAQQRMEALHQRNQELRDKYGIPIERDMSYEDLKGLVPNVMCIDMYDFIEYCKNIRWWYATDSQEEKDQAHQKNVEIRAKYNIAEEDAKMFKYDDIKDDLPNPLGMHPEDYKLYVENREKIEKAAITGEDVSELVAINNQLLQEYYIEDTYSLDELKTYLESEAADNEVLLLQIQISLFYNENGKLANVKSETTVSKF